MKFACEMVCYRVLPLLSKLSNYVEENPGQFDICGIVDPNFTVRSDFDQADVTMFGINAQKQCVAMSIYPTSKACLLTIIANTVAVIMSGKIYLQNKERKDNMKNTV